MPGDHARATASLTLARVLPFIGDTYALAFRHNAGRARLFILSSTPRFPRHAPGRGAFCSHIIAMTNRIHTYTRRPADPAERIELADTDLDYVVVMRRIIGQDAELDRIDDEAFKTWVQASNEIIEQGIR